MSQINLQQGSTPQAPTNVNDVDLVKLLQQIGELKGGDILPPSKDGQQGQSSTELPVLPRPALAAGSSAIALDILLDAIGDKVRQTESKAAISEVKANAAKREAENNEKIKKIQEQIDKLDNASIWDKIGNVFKYIGMALAAVACVAMIATGVGAGVGVAGLVLLGVSLLDNVLDAVGQAVNGQGWGLTSLIALGIEKATGDKEAAQWVKVGLDLAISIAAIACTCGASSGAAGRSLEDVANIIGKVSSIAQGVTGAASSGAAIASAVYTKEAEDARAAQKRLEAILEQLMMMNDVITKHLKELLETTQKTTETVNDIVKENADMQTAILTTGGGTAMA